MFQGPAKTEHQRLGQLVVQGLVVLVLLGLVLQRLVLSRLEKVGIAMAGSGRSYRPSQSHRWMLKGLSYRLGQPGQLGAPALLPGSWGPGRAGPSWPVRICSADDHVACLAVQQLQQIFRVRERTR